MRLLSLHDSLSKMIFVYAVILASIGIIVMVFKEKQKTQQTVLQIIKNWCSIDSVQFEKELSKPKKRLYQMKKNITNVGNKVSNITAQNGRKLRIRIRKNFDSQHLPKKSSDFMKDLKKKIINK